MAGLREALTEGEADEAWAGVAEAWADLLATGAATTTEVVVVAVIALGLPALCIALWRN